jgi:molybdenum cofactor cytidylyltransferase
VSEADGESIGAVILAAGASSRMGKPKQLLEFCGQTLVRRTALAAQEAGCNPVVAT